MSERAERVGAATRRLREAVMAMPEGQAPLGAALALAWGDLGRHCIARWVDDLGICCGRIASALDLVGSRGRDDETREALEGALWRVDATREKLEAVFVLSFGVSALSLYKKGVRFEPPSSGIKARLRDLEEGHEAAGELGQLGRRLAEHTAVLLRNQLSHQVAPIESADSLCFIDVAHLRRGSILRWSGGPFYGEGVLDEGDIGVEALWSRAVKAVDECFDLLVRSVELTGELVASAAVLEPPQRVYKDDETGLLALSDPRR